MRRRFEVVDQDCIGCGLCEERAPENLEIPPGASTARVVKQPETPAEEEACIEASEYCPLGGLRASHVDAPSTGTARGARPPPAPAGGSTPVTLTPDWRTAS